MKPSKAITDLLFRAGLLDAVHALWPRRVTVLAYHRIADPHAPGFDTFRPNVSATPAGFAAQMDFICRRFNAISGSDLVAWIQGQQPLPPRPVLITFDDGYRDNYDHALPVLRQRNLPALIFLATRHMGQPLPFYWDLAAYCFYHTTRREADLSVSGRSQWHDEKSRDVVMREWLSGLKMLPDASRRAAIGQLPRELGVVVAEDAFAGLHLTWAQIRELVAAGVEMGAHTQSHPILTRVPLERARAEAVDSKVRIEAEIDRPVATFAYPNGLPTDFGPASKTMLAQAGFDAAFTLVPGPALQSEIRRDPMAIRRVFISHKDTLPRFAAKVMGSSRLLGR